MCILKSSLAREAPVTQSGGQGKPALTKAWPKTLSKSYRLLFVFYLGAGCEAVRAALRRDSIGHPHHHRPSASDSQPLCTCGAPRVDRREIHFDVHLRPRPALRHSQRSAPSSPGLQRLSGPELRSGRAHEP